MPATAEALTATDIPLEHECSAPTKRDLALDHIARARNHQLSNERFNRVELSDLVIDPKTVRCPEDAIGATPVENKPGTYRMRVSTVEIGAICGIEEQEQALQSLMATIRMCRRGLQESGLGFARKYAGFNAGIEIPSITIEAEVSRGKVEEIDIYKSLMRPRKLHCKPILPVRQDPDFRSCLRAARLYGKTPGIPGNVPPLNYSYERAKATDVVTVFAHFGNSIMTQLIREAGIPALVDVGPEQTGTKRRKFFRALYDVDEGTAVRTRHLIPCRSFAAWVNQAIVSSYLETGRPPLSNNDIRLIAMFINTEAERCRNTRHAQTTSMASPNE